MKKKGRSIDHAINKAAINPNVQPFSQRRLTKDFEEIQNEKIPTVGVTARPLETDLFVWHANIRGPVGTLYEGGVFHLEMTFPHSYPNHPPSIMLFNHIPHPNVFANYVCLDMIQPMESVKREEGAGWSSAYSAQSILTQLQSFLFEENLSEDKAKVEVEIKKSVRQANAYRCNVCKHGGKLSCWPTFSQREQMISDFETIDDEQSLIRKQLVCFHTRLSYTQNQLGLGLKVSKIPRTGNIREAEAYFDYLSIKAFIKESINFTSSNERITHWLPVYFGKGDNEERFFHCLKKALSMIMTNSTKNFKPEFILQVFPKLFITLVYYIMDEKKHPSIRILRILTHIHSMFLFCVNKYPEISAKITENLNKFLASEQNRTKQHISNLGSILAILTAVDSHHFKEVAEAYFLQQLDRQVLWIIKVVPKLMDEQIQQQADKVRTEIVFKSQMTSYHMFCFYKAFMTEFIDKRKSKGHLLEEYESNLCKFTNKEEDQLQTRIFEISKKVRNFSQFFKYIGLKQRTEAETLKLLKDAIKNSSRKKYHGEFQTLHELPPNQEQFKKLQANIPSYKKYINITMNKTQDKDYQVKYSEEISQEQNWKQMCIERWSWIKEVLSYDSTLNANEVAFKALEYAKEGISKTEDRLMHLIKTRYKGGKINYNEYKISLPETDWKRLFLRLDLEDFLIHIDMYPDFPVFYEKLQVCYTNNLNTILIPLIQIHKVKSGYYYLTALLTKLTTLKYLEFSGLPQLNNQLNDKAAKAIKKGLQNFSQAKGKFDIISFYNISANKDYADCLFNILNESGGAVSSLRFNRANLFSYGHAMKSLCTSLANLKDLQEIQLINCSLNQQKCKILADSLMRMKKLKIFTIRDQSSLGQGIAAIIYNLAFSPNLSLLDLGSVNVGTNVAEVQQTVVSLQKLLKISASVQIIKINNISTLNTYLSKQFWLSLGECKSIRVLDVSFSGDLSGKVKQVGNAIAFNGKKKGILQFLNLTGCLSGAQNINNLFWGMNISEYDEEQSYGDPNKLAKMIASNYKKQFYNHLKALQLDRCSNINPNFVLAHYNKLVTKKPPEFVRLLSESPHLESLLLPSAYLQKNIADILVLALDNRREDVISRIQVLDLSKNSLGKDGIKTLAEVLQHNKFLQVLDLSKNYMGVSGADELAKSLKDNISLKYLNVFNNKIGYDGAKSLAQNLVKNHRKLQFLQVGHNRIRDKGGLAIVEALIANPNSSLRILGLRFNFLTNSGILDIFGTLTSQKNGLQELFIRNNLLDDQTIYKLKYTHQQSQSKISVDQLEKVKYLESQRNDRTIWIHPIMGINLQNLKTFFEIKKECGIIIDIRVRNGRKYPNRPGQNTFGFIQFADQMSVTKALHLAAKKQTNVDGVKFRVFKAGTGTFLYSKKTGKQKNLQLAKQLLPTLPFLNAQGQPQGFTPGVLGVPSIGVPPVMGARMPRPAKAPRPARGRGGRRQ